MKKLPLFFLLFFLVSQVFAQVQKELVLNTTGYGFDTGPGTNVHYNGQWDYIQKFMNLTHNGQDASVTAVRFYVSWQSYEPTLGNYKRAELVKAIQDLVNLKGGTLKVALHFPYTRAGFWNDTYLPDSTIARMYDGTKVGDNVANTNPSIFSEWARERFYAFVNDALAQLGSFYNKILYVQMGNSQSEEFSIPYHVINGYSYPGMHDQGAANMWRTQYLPCRYPGQSTVTWDGNTHNIASAPLGAQGQWPSWSSDLGKEFHRFAGWGLMRFFKGFRDVVKNRNNNLKVLYYVSDFGSSQGNAHHMHNSTLPMALNEADGIYTTEAENYNIQEKIAALDVMKGTNPNKLAAIEFDPTDLGQGYAGPEHILSGVAETWMPRAYKHGADYVHIAMHYHDPAIATLAPALALIRSSYVNGSYQSPSRQPATTVNIQPTIFGGSHLFMPTWQDILAGNNWSVTDNSPVSINMIDNGYWENIWTCSGNPDPCAFNVSASGPTGNITVNNSVTLNSSCSGQCSGVSYAWSGNGISGSGNTVTFNAPSTAGSYTYTVTASKSGCSNKTSTHTINVVSVGGGGSICDNYSFSDGQLLGTALSSTVYVRVINSCWYVTTNSPTNSPVALDWLYILINDNGWASGATHFPRSVADSCFKQPDQGCSVDPCASDISVSGPTGNITVNSSVTLNSSCSGQCSGVSYAWSGNGISGSGNTVTFNAPSTAGSYTYTVTASKSGCSNKTSAYTINVVSVGGGGSICDNYSFSDGQLLGTALSSTVYVRVINSCWYVTTNNSTNNPVALDWLYILINDNGWAPGVTHFSRTVVDSCFKQPNDGCNANPCTNTISASGPTGNVTGGSSVTLNASCSGQCSGTSYSWSGNGISGSGSSVTFNAPTTPGTYTYTVTGSKSGCTNKTANVSITVPNPSGINCNTLISDVNGANCSFIEGWIYDPSNPNSTVYIDIYEGATLVISNYPANKFRQDLLNAGYGNGQHAFEISTPQSLRDGQSHVLTFKARGCNYTLSNSPRTLSGCSNAILDPTDIENTSLNTTVKTAVFPNPSKGVFDVSFYLEKGQKATIVLTDMLGRRLLSKAVIGKGTHIERINATNKAAGTMFLSIIKKESTEVKKINITR